MGESPASNALLTVEELRIGLGAKNMPAEADPQLIALIDAASTAVNEWTHRQLKWQSYSDYLYVVPAKLKLLVLEWPITATPTITVNDEAQTIWMPGDAGSPSDSDVQVVLSLSPLYGRWAFKRQVGWAEGDEVLTTFEAGYGGTNDQTHLLRESYPIPPSLKQAAIIVARELYKQPDRQGVVSLSIQGESTGYRQGYSIPPEAQQLLAPFTRMLVGRT